MPTDRLARFRSWPSGVYTDELARLWRAEHPQPSAEVALPDAAAPARTRRLAAVCHVFYVELLDELEAALVNLPERSDLFLSVVDEDDRRVVLDRFRDWSGEVDVRVVENRGRDIAPKYVAFADVYARGYELLLFLHTKKSTYEHVGTPWRQYLFRSLAGSPAQVAGILTLFDRDPALGVLAPQHYGPVAPDTIWQGTFLYASRLARRMGLVVRRWDPPDFASGSMFWARPEALAPITRLRLRLDEFPPEARQVTATNMHALERLVFVAAERAGFRCRLVGTGDPAPQDRASVTASTPESPPLGMWLRAIPPTIRKMAADVEIRRKRFSPLRIVPIVIRRAQGGSPALERTS